MSLTRNLPGASKPTGEEEDGDGGSCSSGCHASLMLTLVSSLLGRLRERKKKKDIQFLFMYMQMPLMQKERSLEANARVKEELSCR